MRTVTASLCILAGSILAAATALDLKPELDRRQLLPPIDPIQCTGRLVCCNSFERASSPSVATILQLLGNPPVSQAEYIGITCSPMSTIGFGGLCAAQPLCCMYGYELSWIIAYGWCQPVNWI
ncbi:hypothetical protein BJ165DRAFT_1616284 [Panaeolus papilionaceus]|nr:hypothetical protein BJ165DRAFT_1616284 [Panaeolus papilionaceus]